MLQSIDLHGYPITYKDKVNKADVLVSFLNNVTTLRVLKLRSCCIDGDTGIQRVGGGEQSSCCFCGHFVLVKLICSCLFLNFDTAKAKSPYKSGYQIFLFLAHLGSNFLKFLILLSSLCTHN